MTEHFEILETHMLTGYLLGSDQPAVVITVQLDSTLLENPAVSQVETFLQQQLGSYEPTFGNSNKQASSILEVVLNLIAALQKRTNYPVLAPPMIQQVTQTDSKYRYRLLFPVLSQYHVAIPNTLLWLSHTFNNANLNLTEHDTKNFAELIKQFSQQAPGSTTRGQMLQAAIEHKVPWRHITDQIYQFGWGKNSRLIDSTFTDKTSNLGSRLVRNKASANLVMQKTGFPVPKHYLASNADHAVELANKLGYPVVVKPANEANGNGVASGLKSADSVVKAYKIAREFSEHVLVEKHVEGNDYRVYVFEGAVIHVVWRIPGSVIGDGSNTIKHLLAEANADPRRHPTAGRWTPIALDQEALDLLQEHGLTEDSIPPAGQRVLLRRTSNIKTGGTPIDIPLAEIHPDNIVLCERVSNLFRLDITGVDLLITDIRNSWRESVVGICEVNCQPRMPLHLPTAVIRRLFTKQGRIPVVLVLDDQHCPWLHQVETTLQKTIFYAGIATHDLATVKGAPVSATVTDCAQAASILLTDPLLDCAVFQISALHMLRNGAPVDRYDLIILSGSDSFVDSIKNVSRSLLSRSATVWHNSDSANWSAVTQTIPNIEILPAEALSQRLLHFITERLE
jgi:cyanophycin synthetase